MIDNGGKILTNPKEVANCMNDYYIKIANEIGNDNNIPVITDFPSTSEFVTASKDYFASHPSITNIKNNCDTSNFTLKHIDDDKTNKIIKSLNPKKATGTDTIPAKALIPAHDILAPVFARLYNMCIDTAKFPSCAKNAEVLPIYKKDDALNKKNHRPVSILTSSSKILEKILDTELTNMWLNDIYNEHLSAFRRGYSCQHVLLSLTEKWHEAIEKKTTPGILLVDLSKAFDCLSHSLTTAKLLAYGLDTNSTTLISDYLSNRYQRVKINGEFSSWERIPKGVPQGSIVGPTIFNIFINDIFQKFPKGSLLNYADDNTIFTADKSINKVKTNLQDASSTIINWCTENQMEANPAKFQTMISGHNNINIEIDANTTILSEPHVKLLGVHIDSDLNFHFHVSNLIKKASRQLNCVKRIAYAFSVKIKLLLYKSFVLSNFNYCAVVWHHCGATNTKNLEKLQLRALRFVFKDYTSSYDDLLQKACLPTLELSRIRMIALEVFKIKNAMSPNYMNGADGMFKPPTNTYNLRSRNSATIYHSSTTRHGLHSFRHYGATIWNQLPGHLKTTTDYCTFKNFINTWDGPKCRCNSCRR